LPLRGGDLSRVLLVRRSSGQSSAQLLALEFLDRAVDFASMIVLALGLLLVLPLPSTIRSAVFSALGLILLLLSFLFIAGYSSRQAAPSGWRRVQKKFSEGARALRQIGPLLLAFLIAFIPWLWETGMLVLMGRALGIPLSLPVAMAVLLTINLSFLLPMPGQVGAYEGLGVATLVFFGVEQSSAVAFMFLFHLAHIMPNSILGLGLFLNMNRIFERASDPG